MFLSSNLLEGQIYYTTTFFDPQSFKLATNFQRMESAPAKRARRGLAQASPRTAPHAKGVRRGEAEAVASIGTRAHLRPRSGLGEASPSAAPPAKRARRGVAEAATSTPHPSTFDESYDEELRRGAAPRKEAHGQAEVARLCTLLLGRDFFGSHKFGLPPLLPRLSSRVRQSERHRPGVERSIVL